MKKAWYFFCPIYFNPETNGVQPRNWFHAHVTWYLANFWHRTVLFFLFLFGYKQPDTFPIKIEDDE